MKPGLKAKWISALRSGDYVQGTGMLRQDVEDKDKPHAFCCLGVLCDLMGADWSNHGIPVLDGVILQKGIDNIDDVHEFGADEYISYAGLEIVDLASAAQVDLATMNDRGSSFATIANHIEETL